jgi:hypothetical protein
MTTQRGRPPLEKETDMDSAPSWLDILDSIAALATTLGLLTFVLFPLALPIVILTIAATLPLLLPIVVLGALAAMLWGVRLGMRAVGRGLRRLRSPRRAPSYPGLG